MANHSTFNPFEVLGLSLSFKIDNLDSIYFKGLKNAENDAEKALINKAYKELKDPIKRAKSLIKAMQIKTNNDNLPKEMMQLFIALKQKENATQEAQKLQADIKDNILKSCKEEFWAEAAENIEKYSYISRMLETL